MKRRIKYPDFVEFINNYDIFSASETHIDDTDIVDIPGFVFFANNRKQKYKRKSGGIGVYVKDYLAPFIDRIEDNSEYILWLKINKTYTHLPEPIVIGSIYLPPENSRFLNEEYLADFENDIFEKCAQFKYVCLAGDTNGRTGQLPDFVPSDLHLNNVFDIDIESQEYFDKFTLLENLSIPLVRSSKDHKCNTNGLRLIQICRSNNLFILNGRLFRDKNLGSFTFRDRSTIDYVIATAECFEMFTEFEVIETDPIFSDGHNALQFAIDIKPQQINASLQEHGDVANKKIWKPELAVNFKQAIDNDTLNNMIEMLSDTAHPQRLIQTVTKDLAELFDNAADKTLPVSKRYRPREGDKPWFGPKCKKARSNYHDAKSAYRSNPTTDNKLRLKHASNSYKRTMNIFIKKYKNQNETKLRALSTSNPKQYWKFLNNLKPKKANINSPSIDEFYQHFRAINQITIHDDAPADLNIPNIHNDNLNSPIRDEEILAGIKNLKNGKSPSSNDNILNEYIKSTKDLLLPVYTKLFNTVLDTGFIPDTWLEGSIIPLYKNKGDPKDPNNYRPITILSCLGKLFTSILNSRLTKYLDSNNILDENQAGFRSGYSCSDHLFTLHALIEIHKKQKRKLYCAFIDFSQAFDRVWRVGLWHKLLQNSINGKFYDVIHNMYQNIKSSVFYNGSKSNTFMSTCGVRQGENLSPMLFALFLNDLQSYLNTHGVVGVELNDHTDLTPWLKLMIMLYADDTILLSDTPTDFQNSLNLFNQYCNNWHLKVNINKTKVVIFGARQVQNLIFKIGTQQLEITKQYHYLGVTFSSNGSFLAARKHVVQQANKALHLLFTRANNADLPIDLVIKLFDHTVLPILTYGSEIFGYENIEMLEKIHNDFLRKITKARKSTPISFLYGELGRYPIAIHVQARMIQFWTRMLIGKEQKISFKVYQYMLSQPNYESKWIGKIKNILNTVGRPDIWQNQSELRHNNLHLLVKQTLIDQFKQSWHDQLLQTNKGIIYNSFKQEANFEPYLTKLPRNE